MSLPPNYHSVFQKASRDDGQTDTPQARQPLAWLRVCALLLTVLLLPAWLGRSVQGTPFDDSPLNALNRLRPDYLFIGNSMVFSRIDHATVSQVLPGRRSHELTMGGVFSAHWYLWLKNSVIPAQSHPATIFLFFRQDELTQPYRSVSTPEERLALQRASCGTETVLEETLNWHRPALDWIDEFSFRLYPIQMQRQAVEWTLDSLALLPAMPGFFAARWRDLVTGPPLSAEERESLLTERQRFKKEIKDTLFAPSGFRNRPDGTPAILPEPTEHDRSLSFADQLPHSLLPEMVRLARTHGLRLVFVMVKPRPRPDGPGIRSREQVQYAMDLERYLVSQGMGFHDDFAEGVMLWPDYHDGWHLVPSRKALYTQNFIHALRRWF